MFNDDITPEAVDVLVTELSAMLEVESITPTRLPAARMTVSGTVRRVEMQAVRDLVFLDGGKRGSCYMFTVDDFLATLRQIAQGAKRVELAEDDSPRVVVIERAGDRLHFWMHSGTFSIDAAEFLRCAARAGLGVSA